MDAPRRRRRAARRAGEGAGRPDYTMRGRRSPLASAGAAGRWGHPNVTQ